MATGVMAPFRLFGRSVAIDRCIHTSVQSQHYSNVPVSSGPIQRKSIINLKQQEQKRDQPQATADPMKQNYESLLHDSLGYS